MNGKEVDKINAALTSGTDLSSVAPLRENRGRSLLGVQKSGPFDISGDIARTWLKRPLNPNGRPNSDVLRPSWNGDDVTSRPRDYWLIDFPRGLTESRVSLWEEPFGHLLKASYDSDDPQSLDLKSERQKARDRHAQEQWWEPYWPRPEMRRSIEHLERYLVTPETPTHNIFRWLQNGIVPDKNLIVFPVTDDTSFGILQSTFHILWTQALGAPYGNHPTARRYNSSSVFETFPFPEGLTPNIPAADYTTDPRAIRIAAAAARLNELRENWLNPADLVKRVPEVVPGYPDRILPKDEAAEAVLKKRTLTNLYNQRPAWLNNAHKALDEAVAEAYGWGDDWRAGKMTDDEILARLFKLNQERAASSSS